MMRDVHGKLGMMWEGITMHSVVALHQLPKVTVNRARQ